MFATQDPAVQPRVEKPAIGVPPEGPVDLSGKWTGTGKQNDNEVFEVSMTLTQEGNTITGIRAIDHKKSGSSAAMQLQGSLNRTLFVFQDVRIVSKNNNTFRWGLLTGKLTVQTVEQAMVLTGPWETVPPSQFRGELELWKENKQVALDKTVDKKPQPPAEAAGPAEDPPKVRRDGGLVLKTCVAIINGVQAWVEIDGEKKADWKVGSTQVSLTLPEGLHQVTVYSIHQNKKMTIYDKQLRVAGDTTATVDVGP